MDNQKTKFVIFPHSEYLFEVNFLYPTKKGESFKHHYFNEGWHKDNYIVQKVVDEFSGGNLYRTVHAIKS